jgi:hypothetical protein
VKIKKEFPPNMADIEKVFDLEGLSPIFAYGDTLYNPGGYDIPEDLMVHEETHERQQLGLGPKAWWIKYLNDKEFRLSQEVEAYRAQYAFVKTKYSRQVRRHLLQQMAKNLSSKLYGNIVNKKEAEYLIEHE